MKKILIILITCLTLFISCLTVGNKNLQNDSILGNWSFIDQNGYYTEIYVNDSTLSMYSDDFDDFFGTIDYILTNDSLSFLSEHFAIEYQSFNKIKLSNQDINYILNRIQILAHNSTESINPFYIRRCSYLVNNGSISMKEAVDYLNLLFNKDIEPVEDIYLY